jgi:hypothetical protein
MVKIEIEISYECSPVLEICIDNKPIQYTISENKISADVDFLGLAMLTVKSLNDSKIKIANLYIDKVCIRQFLFLSWVEKDQQKIQPCTELWEPELTWNLPISNPLCLLINIANEKFETGDLGTNLYEKYDIFYPESIQVESYYPNIVKDFFKYNFDFYAHKRIPQDQLYANLKTPYFCLDFEFDASGVHKELLDNYDYLLGEEFIKPFQLGYNQDDQGENFDSRANWRTVYPYVPRPSRKNAIEDFALDKNKLPLLYQLYKSLPTDNIYHSYVSVMPPKSFIAPHIDIRKDLVPHGCTQMYFSLNPSDDHFFKINSVGMVPLINKVVVINNQKYTHAVVNQSSEPRFVIGCFADVSREFYTNVIQ